VGQPKSFFALRLVKALRDAYCVGGGALGAVVSASRLHRVGRGFESLSAHHPSLGTIFCPERGMVLFVALSVVGW
jgi:hypothetical protein